MRIAVLSAAFVAALLGCETGPKVVSPEPPSKVNVVEKDLPAPAGFTYLENVSNKSPTGAFRVVNQSLQGQNQRVEHAAKFFKDTYPVHGWTLESEDGPKDGVARLAFTNKNERCRIEIKEDRSTTNITIKVNRKD